MLVLGRLHRTAQLVRRLEQCSRVRLVARTWPSRHDRKVSGGALRCQPNAGIHLLTRRRDLQQGARATSWRSRDLLLLGHPEHRHTLYWPSRPATPSFVVRRQNQEAARHESVRASVPGQGRQIRVHRRSSCLVVVRKDHRFGRRMSPTLDAHICHAGTALPCVQDAEAGGIVGRTACRSASSW
jgi:hypothetical protein